MKLRQQGDWVYAKVGNTEMRGKKDPQGTRIQQVSPSYVQQELDEAVKMIEEFFGKVSSAGGVKEYTPSPFGQEAQSGNPCGSGRRGKPIEFGKPMSPYRTKKAESQLAEIALTEEAKRIYGGRKPKEFGELSKPPYTPSPWGHSILQKPQAALSKEELTPDTIDLLAVTEGNPLRKFCCRQCGECAPKELLEEGRFPERIDWLRHHYKEKHPGMWAKARL